MGKALLCTALGIWLRWKAAKQGYSQLLINAEKERCPQAKRSLEQFCRCEWSQSLPQSHLTARLPLQDASVLTTEPRAEFSAPSRAILPSRESSAMLSSGGGRTGLAMVVKV